MSKVDRGGSYVRRKDGELERVESTAPARGREAEADRPPAETGQAQDGAAPAEEKPAAKVRRSGVKEDGNA